MIAALGPTPFWYASRGSGFTALLLLTASVVLGLVTSVRWHTPAWPRFVTQDVHRTVSLFAVLFLVIHIAAAVIDPFAGLSLRDAVVPVGASYRPLWLGLGVIGAELFVAVLLTSLARHRLSFGVWRAVHLLAYVSWPVAVLHGIGTGTDTKAVWALLLTVACVGAVAVAVVWRISAGWPSLALLRITGIGVSLGAVVALAAWTLNGPLQPGWARAAGTPANLLASAPTAAATARPQPAPLAAGLNDPLAGRLDRSATSNIARLDDQRDPSLHVTILVSADGAGTLTVTRSGSQVCAARATITNQVTARCGGVDVLVNVVAAGPAGGGPVSLTGTLVTRAPGQ